MNNAGHIYLEFAQVGNSVEVRAVDAADGLEVAFIAPVNTPEAEVTLIARRKLDYVRRKQAQKTQSEAASSKTQNRDGRRGIIV